MRALSILAAVPGILAASTALSADGPAGRRNPYENLFTGRLTIESTVPSSIQRPPLDPWLEHRPVPAVKIVCGMTIIPGDPKIDARIFIPELPGGVKFTMRTIPPPICGQ